MSAMSQDPTSGFPPSFFTDDRMSEMWSYVRYWLGYVNKPVMIGVALIMAGIVAVIIIDIFAQARETSNKVKDDDDFDFY